MFVKLMIPILGKNIVKTTTFADKGNRLIKGLNQYKEKKDSNPEAVDNLISLLNYHKTNWLEKAIRQHFAGEPVGAPEG